MNQLVVIRDYRPGDELCCQEIVKEGTMSSVNAAFIAGLTREFTFQVMILLTAIMFIFLGIPFSICLGSIPFVIVIMYICVWMGHSYKAMEMNREVLNIPRKYMSSEYTGFWVAEVYEPYFITREPNQVKYTVLTEQQLKNSNMEISSVQKKVVGTIAITRNKHGEDSAWLRRMVVNKKYQRKGVAAALVDEALKFCVNKGYSSVELITSECHDAARELYLKKGFELKQMYHKQIIGTFVTILRYDLIYKIKTSNYTQSEVQHYE